LLDVIGLEQVVAFVGVTDLERAERFYGAVLGLPLRDERPFALVADVGGSALRITRVEALDPAPYTVLGWNVADIEAAVDDLAGRGVTFNRYDGMAQDGRGIWTSPSGARVAWFLDPDGNNLSLTQHPAG
jgi:catechol 2,3-dioxygenase-like lactoylglutathione lyase family enzyme